MERKLTKISNKILIFSLLILLVDFLNTSLIANFYSVLVYILGLSGIILSLVIKLLIKYEYKYLDKFYELIDTLSVVWTFFLVFYTIVSFLLYPARVNGSSMKPNYEDKDIIVVWHLNHEIERFDVVLVNVTNERHFYPNDEYFLKRVIGLPGEYIEYRNNILYVNGEEIEESFRTNTDTYDFGLENYCRIKNEAESCVNNIIPEGYYFVLGDNRDNSTDSRRIGLVHESDIFGKSIFTFNDLLR
ncbi:signal peptidase I [Mycoplasmatota bacterium WC44]